MVLEEDPYINFLKYKKRPEKPVNTIPLTYWVMTKSIFYI